MTLGYRATTGFLSGTVKTDRDYDETTPSSFYCRGEYTWHHWHYCLVASNQNLSTGQHDQGVASSNSTRHVIDDRYIWESEFSIAICALNQNPKGAEERAILHTSPRLHTALRTSYQIPMLKPRTTHLAHWGRMNCTHSSVYAGQASLSWASAQTHTIWHTWAILLASESAFRMWSTDNKHINYPKYSQRKVQ